MPSYEIKKGWMNTILGLDDGIVLKMTVADLKEMINDIVDSCEKIKDED